MPSRYDTIHNMTQDELSAYLTAHYFEPICDIVNDDYCRNRRCGIPFPERCEFQCRNLSPKQLIDIFLSAADNTSKED